MPLLNTALQMLATIERESFQLALVSVSGASVSPVSVSRDDPFYVAVTLTGWNMIAKAVTGQVERIQPDVLQVRCEQIKCGGVIHVAMQADHRRAIRGARYPHVDRRHPGGRGL